MSVVAYVLTTWALANVFVALLLMIRGKRRGSNGFQHPRHSVSPQRLEHEFMREASVGGQSRAAANDG